MSSACATLPATLSRSSVGQSPVADCFHPKGVPELANHTFRDTPTASENAFVNRFTKLGGSRQRRLRRRQPRTRRRRTHIRTQQRHKQKKKRHTSSKTRRRGGVGFRFDLSACPVGGMATPTQYETH